VETADLQFNKMGGGLEAGREQSLSSDMEEK
jgi:hypothetical protein